MKRRLVSGFSSICLPDKAGLNSLRIIELPAKGPQIDRIYNRTLASAYTVVLRMGLDVVHRRWLLVGPCLVAGGFLGAFTLLTILGDRRAISYGVMLIGAGLLVSLVSAVVSLTERWPPSRGWTPTDLSCLLVGTLPLILLAFAGFVAVADIGG